jgi:hypothetical protein
LSAWGGDCKDLLVRSGGIGIESLFSLIRRNGRCRRTTHGSGLQRVLKKSSYPQRSPSGAEARLILRHLRHG